MYNCLQVGNKMWKIQYKPNNDTQVWSIYACYENKAQAFIHASRISSEYFKVEVIDSDGNVVWSHYN